MDTVKAYQRHDITDELWSKIAPFFPNGTGKRGRPAGDNRRFFNAVAWIMRSGASWRDLPPDYGNWNSIFVRFRRVAKAGFWEKLNYATKQTYDARMWQTIEYKAAAIE